MPDVPIPPEPEEAEPSQFYQAVWGFGGYVDAQLRRAATGDTDGRLRRPILFAVAGVALILGGAAIPVGIVALFFLALTDQVPA